MNLSELFEYRDGCLYWRVQLSNRGPVGSRAGWFHVGTGYRYLGFLNKKFKEHRIVWELHHGPIPNGLEIDHINGDKTDNRIENLRLCTRTQNNFNTRRRRNTTQPYRGVRLRCDGKKYVARINFHGVEYHLGSYDTEEQAIEAYRTKARELAGEFIRQ